MGRLPTTADFPAPVKLDIVPPPGSDPPTNILLLLHGLGDTQASFTRLARQLKLPETACISLNGPAALLDLGGSHWCDDILFDSSSDGGLDPDAGFISSTKLLHSVVEDVLVQKCGYRLREISFFGFGQGGMAALSFAASLPSTPLAGVISIGAGLSSSAPASLTPKLCTPLLVCAGSSSSSSVTPSSEDKLKRVFENLEVKRWRRPGDSMPSNRDEMMPVMQFFARTLRSVKGVPEGSVEVG